jgi:hypothetical protein
MAASWLSLICGRSVTCCIGVVGGGTGVECTALSVWFGVGVLI